MIICQNDCDNIVSGATWQTPPTPHKLTVDSTRPSKPWHWSVHTRGQRSGEWRGNKEIGDFTWYIIMRDHSRLSESYDAGLTHIPARWLAHRQCGEKVCFHSENHLSTFKYPALPQVVTSRKHFALSTSFYFFFFPLICRARLYRNEPFEDWAQRLE